MDWIFEMTRPLRLYISLFLSVHRLTRSVQLCGCGVAKILAPCCSPAISRYDAPATPNSLLHAIVVPRRRIDVVLFSSHLLSSPRPEVATGALTSCQTACRDESQSSEFPVRPGVEHRNSHRLEEKRTLEVNKAQLMCYVFNQYLTSVIFALSDIDLNSIEK